MLIFQFVYGFGLYVGYMEEVFSVGEVVGKLGQLLLELGLGGVSISIKYYNIKDRECK